MAVFGRTSLLNIEMHSPILLRILVLLLTVLYDCLLLAGAQPSTLPQTFGVSLAQGRFLPGQEYELFSQQGKGVITYFWATEYNPNGRSFIGSTLFRYYIDGEEVPSIECTLDMFGGIGWNDNSAPWGTDYFGKGAYEGSVYNTMRVPFSSSVRMTGLLSPYQNDPVIFWYVVRGTLNLGITIGGYPLPDNTRLRMQEQTVFMRPTEYLDLVQTKSAGAVWMITLQGRSSNLNYLEGCFRMYIGNNTTPQLLSSGTEDYFQSAYYFQAGTYHFPEAGLTHWNLTLNQMSAYKVHNLDPLFFVPGGFRLTWRNGEMWNPKTGLKCFDSGPVVGHPQHSDIKAAAWWYEY